MLCLAGCAHEEPQLIEDMKYFEGDMPADFSGYWVRDYARGDNINQVLRNAYYVLDRRADRAGSATGRASERADLSDEDRQKLIDTLTGKDTGGRE